MSKHVKHVPKHRAAPPRHALVKAQRKALHTTVMLSSLAVAATGATIVGGILNAPAAVTNASADAGSAADQGWTSSSGQGVVSSDIGEREPLVSRSDTRLDSDPAKAAALDADAGEAMIQTENLSQGDPREIAKALLAEFGFGQDQFGCLDSLYTRESGWRVNADNPYSSAYGIPQALPGSKMSSAGSDWATNPVTQIRWGLGYIQDRYGSPCGAWSHSQGHGWY